MRILVLSQYWSPENGVPQRRWDWLTGVLVDAGHDVVVVAPPPHYKRHVTLKQWVHDKGFRVRFKSETGNHGETVLRTGFFPSGDKLSQRIFNQAWISGAMILGLAADRRTLSRNRPDVVIGTVPALPTSVVTLVASRLLKAPYIIDLRDAWPALFREHSEWNKGTGSPSRREQMLKRGPFQLLIRISELAVNIVLDRATAIITTSERLGQEVKVQRTKPTATVRNVFPAVEKGTVPLHDGLTADTLRVLYAGTLGRAQRLDNALEAAKIARDVHGVDVALRFVGDGASWDLLNALAVELDVDATFAHQKKPTDLGAELAWADTALVHLADWQSLESAIPSKTYELMSNEIHISAVASGETRDLVTALNAGDVVRPGHPEELAQLWADLKRDPSRLRVSAEGGAWVEKERTEVAPRAFLDIIDHVAGRRKQAAGER